MLSAIPNLRWYKKTSLRLGLRPRCPFASVERCPRYFQSLALLGRAGSTALDAREESRLTKRWKRHDLWPKVAEHETSLMGPARDIHIFSHFCPEVIFDRFGYFASDLTRYADETDAD